MPSLHHPLQNHLLAALPAEDFDRLQPHLELVPMRLGEALYESGGKLSHVYFPTTSIVSLLYVLENGSSAEIAIVGNEGLLGIALFMAVTQHLAALSSRALVMAIASRRSC